MPLATTPDGTRLYFETLGSGAPLLLLAGQSSDHREWDGVRADWASLRHTLVPPEWSRSHPGHSR